MAAKPKGKSNPAKGYAHRRRGFSVSWEDLIEAAVYAVGLDVAGQQLDARGTNLPLGLSGQDAAAVGAMWYGKAKHNKRWFLAGLMRAGPAIQTLTGGLAGSLLGGGAGAAPALPAPAPAPAPQVAAQPVAGALPAAAAAAGGQSAAGAGSNLSAAGSEELIGLEDLFEGLGDFLESDILGF